MKRDRFETITVVSGDCIWIAVKGHGLPRLAFWRAVARALDECGGPCSLREAWDQVPAVEEVYLRKRPALPHETDYSRFIDYATPGSRGAFRATVVEYP